MTELALSQRGRQDARDSVPAVRTAALASAGMPVTIATLVRPPANSEMLNADRSVKCLDADHTEGADDATEVTEMVIV